MITKRGVKDAALFIIQLGPSPGGPCFYAAAFSGKRKGAYGKT